MTSTFRRLSALAVCAAIGLLGTSARADMLLTITDVGTGTTVTVDDAGTGLAAYGSFTGVTFGNYTIYEVAATGNYDGNTNGIPNVGTAQVESVLLNLTQKTGTTDTLLVSVQTFGASSWSIPTGNPLTLTSTNSVSTLNGSNGTTSGTFATFSSTLLSGTSSTTVNAPNATSVATFTNSGPAANPSPPFYLSNTLSVTTTGVNQVVNLSASTTAVAPVPEPSTGVIALAGAVLMGAFGWRRRRGV